MNLSRIQLAGIALTIVWIIGFTYSTFTERQSEAKRYSEVTYKSCVETNATAAITEQKNCEKDRDETFAIFTSGSLSTPLTIASVMVPIGWFAGTLLVYLYRITIAGYRSVVDWQTLTRPKKAFVVFMITGAIISALFSILAMAVLSIDSKVPVSLGYKTNIYALYDAVVAEGTWTVVGGKSDTPLQHSKIRCYRTTKDCYEAKASVQTTHGAFLTVDILRYDVVTWTNTTIIYVDRNICYDDIYTIDLISKTVNGVTRASPDAARNKCKPSSASDGISKQYRLADGFEVHQSLRREASPWLVRVFASLLGAR